MRQVENKVRPHNNHRAMNCRSKCWVSFNNYEYSELGRIWTFLDYSSIELSNLLQVFATDHFQGSKYRKILINVVYGSEKAKELTYVVNTQHMVHCHGKSWGVLML